MGAPSVPGSVPASTRGHRSLRRRVAATAGMAGLLLTTVPGSAALAAPAPSAQADCAASDWTIGAIRERYVALQGPCGFLGAPLTRETPTPVRLGAFNHFEGGSIYWSPGTGAHEVHGAIRAAWERQGWENSPVGFPLTDEVPTPDTFGAFNHFEAGSIYWAPTTGAYEVRGGIRDAWGHLG